MCVWVLTVGAGGSCSWWNEDLKTCPMMNTKNGAGYQLQRHQLIPNWICTRSGKICAKWELGKIIERQCFFPLDFLCIVVYQWSKNLKKYIFGQGAMYHVPCFVVRFNCENPLSESLSMSYISNKYIRNCLWAWMTNIIFIWKETTMVIKTVCLAVCKRDHPYR